jgi:hypothetical protein
VADEDGVVGLQAGFVEMEVPAELGGGGLPGGGEWEVVVVEEQLRVESFGEGTADEGFDDVSES